jgi:hypothetical protein
MPGLLGRSHRSIRSNKVFFFRSGSPISVSPPWHEINAAASAEQNLNIDFLLSLVERGVWVRFWNTTSKYSTESPEALCR